ncbi:pyrroline-5-carboxylate reductase [Rhizobium leguminosarum bv. trifolii WSM597]|uniref:Pyrroline-5-carboxylate reductase n=1 Tax=Rhizobium leguminosarum bv. trifolii WSM597 TaxID=754764 RepID=J0H9L0_RHILT|nr:pyrroline-5-carboxylate reductase [Rhizobium leguminosarum]EJB07043.1 pyrroline-5-carboxylate reductase [Rhizobium leguminosarum bv. trifolii WSM597]
MSQTQNRVDAAGLAALKGRRIALFGAGNMGGAMLRGWLAAGFRGSDILVVDPNPSNDTLSELADAGGRHVQSPEPGDVAEFVILAVKPQILDSILPMVGMMTGTSSTIISVAAGKALATFTGGFDGCAVVRAMPNLPALIGRGLTGAYANDTVNLHQKLAADVLLSVLGKVVWLDREAEIDALTAISGSGPAYLFFLAECLKEAGTDLGLSSELAGVLARQTIIGAAAMLDQSSEEPQDLRKKVTSPGGTTQAALDVLMRQNGMRELLSQAVAAAHARSLALAASA